MMTYIKKLWNKLRKDEETTILIYLLNDSQSIEQFNTFLNKSGNGLENINHLLLYYNEKFIGSDILSILIDYLNEYLYEDYNYIDDYYDYYDYEYDY